MKKSQTKSILAMVTIDKELVLDAGVPTIVAKDKEEQEGIASELGRVLAGNVYGLKNGVIIITQE
ncbi:capping complex subunit for YIEGIA [Dethiothermospora halolimnae]|uniref:capping complex subunit for YIEGIA n=1 Tax=Dethiothermospora halolimnae TaxID=3114390 RepID=UPI003CCC4557